MSFKEYYNVLPTMKSPAPSPTSSEDSGVPIEESGTTGPNSNAPRRPPRARDDPPATHEYHNLPPFGHDYQNQNSQNTQNDYQNFQNESDFIRRRAITPPPPRLPKRQPLLARPKTPPPPLIRRPYQNPMPFQHQHQQQHQQQQHLSVRHPSVSSSTTTTTTTATAQHCQPFRRRFQVRKKRTGGSCKCKTPAGKNDLICLG